MRRLFFGCLMSGLFLFYWNSSEGSECSFGSYVLRREVSLYTDCPGLSFPLDCLPFMLPYPQEAYQVFFVVRKKKDGGFDFLRNGKPLKVTTFTFYPDSCSIAVFYSWEHEIRIDSKTSSFDWYGDPAFCKGSLFISIEENFAIFESFVVGSGRLHGKVDVPCYFKKDGDYIGHFVPYTNCVVFYDIKGVRLKE